MSPEEPTQDQLLAMAYSDGELSSSERQAFELRLTAEPDLNREVAEYRALQVLSRQMAPPEPMDHEWKRLAKDPAQKGLQGLGWVCFVAGIVGLGGLGIFGIATSSEPLEVRLLGLTVVAGFVLLLLATVRGRLRTFHLDPYREVQR